MYLCDVDRSPMLLGVGAQAEQEPNPTLAAVFACTLHMASEWTAGACSNQGGS
jgi:hypothetical protein